MKARLHESKAACFFEHALGHNADVQEQMAVVGRKRMAITISQ